MEQQAQPASGNAVLADTDHAWIVRAQAGDFDAFEHLILKYEKQLFALASYIVGAEADAEEVVQDTFLSVLEHLSEYRAEASFKTWITRIATNFALKVLRARKAHPTTPLLDGEGDLPAGHPEFIAQWRDDPVRIAMNAETRELLRQALAEIPEKYRIVFVLRDVEELSVQETADALNLTVENVKVRLMRARLMLRERLTRAFGDPSTQMRPDHNHD